MAAAPSIEEYSRKVAASPLDFTSWTFLLGLVEKAEPETVPVERFRAFFDAFLAEFPYCFGYWNKVSWSLL
jgi:pre-mRNA-processing factor 39